MMRIRDYQKVEINNYRIAPGKPESDLTTLSPECQDIFTKGSYEHPPVEKRHQTADFSISKTPGTKIHSNEEVKSLLKHLSSMEVDQSIIKAVERDLDFRRNEKNLRSFIAASPKQRNWMLKALETSKIAHKSQTQTRSGSEEGLESIPYVNHCVQVANMAFLLKLTPQAVMAALLHDTVEDTPITLNDLRKKGFDKKTIELVAHLTKTPEESRAAYLERVDKMTGEAKILKCLDRYHNLIRAFTTEDREYLNRYIREAGQHYAPSYEKLPGLSPLQDSFNTLLNELKKFRDSLPADPASA